MQLQADSFDARTFVFPLMGMLSGLIGLAFLIFGALDVFAVRALEERGLHAHGVVEGVSNHKGPASAEVEFQAKDGSVVVFRTSFQGVLQQGDEVSVVYLPEHPKTARVEGFQEMWGAVIFKCVVGSIGSIASIVLFTLTARLARKRRVAP